MLIPILTTIAIVVVILVIVVAMRPNEFVVQRTGFISASPEVTFAQVNDLHKWQAWSPWAKMDPNAKTTYAGPPAGVGASFSWAGNNKIGEGRMTIIDSVPSQRVRFDLEFFKPFAGRNIAEFTFTPQGSQTSVTWTMTGKNNFMAKAFHLVINCDKMIGGQFEQGFVALNLAAQAAQRN